MKKRLIILSSIALLGLASACNDHKPVKGGEHIEQTVLLYNVDGATSSKANSYKADAISLTAGDGVMSVEKSFSLGLVKPADQDLELKVRVSPTKAKEHMAATNSKYELLPEELISLPEYVKILKGEMMSETANLNVKIDESKIKEGVDYIFAITLGGANEQSIKLSEINNSLVYTLKLSPAGKIEIIKALQMERANYLKVEPRFDKHPNTITVETFINVGKFRNAVDVGDAQISSFWGIEGHGLFRFGDSGLPGNKLQAYGQNISNFEFQENRWYHIAAVFEKGNMIVYVDGKEIAKVPGKNPVLGSSSWFIGRSYNDNRGIQAKFSEFRVWSVARTADEINENMFGVDPSTQGLLAYWKMDKAEGNQIKDLSPNGHNLIHVSQPGIDVNCDIISLKNPIELAE